MEEATQAPTQGDKPLAASSREVINYLATRIGELELDKGVLRSRVVAMQGEIDRLREENAEQAEQLSTRGMEGEPEPTAPPMDKAPT